MSLADPIAVVAKLTVVLDELGIRYMIGGSLASSLYGIPRATQDVDVVADVTESHVGPLADRLSPYFYFDAGAAKDAVRRRSSFNIIDKEEIFKIDVFVMGVDDISGEEMERRSMRQVADAPGREIWVCSPEDIVAHKLHWYKLGDGVSDRQWNDARNVIRVQGKRLDLGYLRRVCAARGVLDLLEKALA